MFKKLIILVVLLILPVLFGSNTQARKQWTEKQAWAWQKKLGPIKGFNQPEPPYPNMEYEQMLRKAHELGFNAIRLWFGQRTPDLSIERLKKIVDMADKYGITVQPVLTPPIPKSYMEGPNKGKISELASTKEYTHKMIRAFAKDKRVIIWDLWNEPGNTGFDPSTDLEYFRLHLEAIRHIVEWAREENPVQALTSSIYWRGDIVNNPETPIAKLAAEVEGMMDVHNFHQYNASADRMGWADKLFNKLRSISNRPLVSTECLTRVNGSGVARTMVLYEKNNVNFYVWGLYANDANWEVKWNRTTYDPYEPMFHNLLHPDGTPYDDAELDWIRNFKFTNGQDVDPGTEVTERWPKWRGWKWMSGWTVKGLCTASPDEALQILSNGMPNHYNCIRVKLDHAAFVANKESFFKKLESVLAEADKAGVAVLPTLLNDDDAVSAADKDLAEYCHDVVARYYSDSRILAWNLYDLPGKKLTDTQRLQQLLPLIFRITRFQYPNQPLFATPWVSVKPFAADFNYRQALIHGRRNGWNHLQYEGGGSADLTYQIWGLSDVTAYASEQPSAEMGWLASIAYRYGRPVFCTSWAAKDTKDAENGLGIFSRSHIFWFTTDSKTMGDVSNFKFKPITTKH